MVSWASLHEETVHHIPASQTLQPRCFPGHWEGTWARTAHGGPLLGSVRTCPGPDGQIKFQEL